MSDPEATARSVLIVGVAGEIGTAVSTRLPELLGNRWVVRGADLRADDAHGIEPLDITDLEAYSDVCAGIDTLVELVDPRGVAVCLEAAHLCTQMRGVAEDGSRTVTTFWRGAFEDNADLRREFLQLVH